MLANAISSAVDRLYAAVPVADERAAVPRVGAVVPVARVKSTGQGEADADTLDPREERERLQQRQSLTRGVLAVFETGATTDTATEPGASDKDGSDRPKPAEMGAPDPVLEAAILRFIHSMFRTLAAEEPSLAQARPPGGTGNAEKSLFQIPSESREALGARIEALAQRLAQTPDAAQAGASAEADPPAPDAPVAPAPGAAPMPDQNLQQAFAEVVQALRGNLGSSEPQAQSTRAELVSMMQRLAQAMQGTPPIDGGLSTRGGLLSAQA